MKASMYPYNMPLVLWRYSSTNNVKNIPWISSSWVQKNNCFFKIYISRSISLTIHNYFLFFCSVWKKKRICDHYELHSRWTAWNFLLIRRGDIRGLQHLRWSSLWQLLTAVNNYHKELNLIRDVRGRLNPILISDILSSQN